MRGATPARDPRGMTPDDRTSTPAPSASNLRRRMGALGPAILAGCSVATALTALVIGWFLINFHLMGETADAEDYTAAAAAYGAGALLLVLGAVDAWARRYAEWVRWVAALPAGLIALLAASAASRVPGAEPGSGFTHWYDGAAGLLACPWTWPLVIMPVATLLRTLRVGRGRLVSG